MDWSLVPARKRTFNFWPVARGMKDVSMNGTVERKRGLCRALVRRPCSGGAQHVRHPRMQRATGRKFLAF